MRLIAGHCSKLYKMHKQTKAFWREKRIGQAILIGLHKDNIIFLFLRKARETFIDRILLQLRMQLLLSLVQVFSARTIQATNIWWRHSHRRKMQPLVLYLNSRRGQPKICKRWPTTIQISFVSHLKVTHTKSSASTPASSKPIQAIVTSNIRLWLGPKIIQDWEEVPQMLYQTPKE